MRPLKTLKKLYEEEAHIVVTERSSPPRVIFSGEDLLQEYLPEGTRVILPRPPMGGVPNLKAAVRWALNHPEGSEPLHALLKPGMRVTVALDDLSVPLPPMRAPDVRQTILEIVLELFADSGVDDVHLVVANGLNRRLTPTELRRMVGGRIYDAFGPDRIYNHDAEDPGGMVSKGEGVALNRRAAESNLIVYVSLSGVPTGPRTVATGLTDYATLKAAEAKGVERLGQAVEKILRIFQIEAALNNRMFDGPASFLGRKEEEYTEIDRLKLQAMRFGLQRLPRTAKRKLLFNLPAAYEVIGVHAGAPAATREKVAELCARQHVVPVEGQADVLIFGVPYVSPHSVNSILNPILLQAVGLGDLLSLHRGTPLLRKGGVIVLCHPAYDEFEPAHHPSSIEFFHRLLPETRDAKILKEKYERAFAENPSYVHLYRKGNAYHGVHPFQLWYRSEAGRQHAGKVIVAGAENNHVPEVLGWDRADTLSEAIEAARGFAGRSAQLSFVHSPPSLLTDVRAGA